MGRLFGGRVFLGPFSGCIPEPGAETIGGEEGKKSNTDDSEAKIPHFVACIRLMGKVEENAAEAGNVADETEGPIEFFNHGEIVRPGKRQRNRNCKESGGVRNGEQLDGGGTENNVVKFKIRLSIIVEFKPDGVGPDREGAEPNGLAGARGERI